MRYCVDRFYFYSEYRVHASQTPNLWFRQAIFIRNYTINQAYFLCISIIRWYVNIGVAIAFSMVNDWHLLLWVWNDGMSKKGILQICLFPMIGFKQTLTSSLVNRSLCFYLFTFYTENNILSFLLYTDWLWDAIIYWKTVQF